MIEYFSRVATLLWPHAVLILATSWLGVRSPTLLRSALVGIATTVMATLVYWAIQNGIAPDREALIAGQLIALFLAGAISLLAASVSGYLARHRGVSEMSAVSIGVAVGFLFLLPMPTLQLRLGCWFTGICP